LKAAFVSAAMRFTTFVAAVRAAAAVAALTKKLMRDTSPFESR
jgi:hypothetical protein